MFFIGLGNPGEEYVWTRHNTGRMLLEFFAKTNDFPDFEFDKVSNALVSSKKIGKEKVVLVLPQTFMNKSGSAVGKLIKNKKELENMVVFHDDLDIPFGNLKISFNKSSGGHRGVESIIKVFKSEAFSRVRFGICPVSPSGKQKKPKGEKAVGDFILGGFSKGEKEDFKKMSKKINEAMLVFVKDGRGKAMSEFNKGRK